MNISIKTISYNQLFWFIIALAAFLRCYHLDFQSIWVDELHTMIEANPAISFKESIDLILYREGIPPFYFFIIKTLFSGFGYTILIARFFSVLVGLWAVYGIYKLTLEFVSEKWALLAALFMAIHPFLIEYSQEARTYMLYMTLTIFMYLYLVRYIRDTSYTSLLLFSFFAGLSVNAHVIGLLNVGTAFVILGLNWIFSSTKTQLFKQLMVATLCFVLVSIPIFSTLKSVASYTSFWILKPTLPYTVEVFTTLFGESIWFLALFLVFYGYYIVTFSKQIKSIPKEKRRNYPELHLFILLNLWIWIPVGIIFIKSILGVSIVLHRYFIAIIPAFVIILALAVKALHKEKIQRFLVYGLSGFILIHFIFVRKYYTTITKAQYDKIAQYVIENNDSKHNIVSNWGWLMSYYFNSSNGLFSIERNLDDYLTAMRQNQVPQTSFWYMDGNSRTFQVSAENQAYLEANFEILNKKEFHDCWAVELKSKNNSNLYLTLQQFNPSQFDGSGAMIFVNNMKSKHPSFTLEPGTYTIKISGRSLPEQPINGENAHFNVYINGKKAGSIYLSEKTPNTPIEFEYVHSGGNIAMELEYDNDFGQNGLDRNAIINTIQWIKK